ncbi:MAG TPA: hypothetical protein DHV55_05370, partial [Clostridiaceae bacterium]|nr:hypothetical protein [Clostridiaceae bacterium]
MVQKRFNGQNCPYCQNKKVSPENSITVTHPHLVEEWNYERNEGLRPEIVSAGSHKNVWWRCIKDERHQSKANVYDRALAGQGCPHCINRAVNEMNNLASLRPDIAKDWDYEKNYPLTPQNVVVGSGKKIWWKCENNHPLEEWRARVVDRIKG